MKLQMGAKPPFVMVAVKITKLPAAIVLLLAATLIAGTNIGFTVTITGVLVWLAVQVLSCT
jgi:heme exporter protein D